MQPLVTIIIPTRERADTLKFSLKTATAQSYPNLEIIVSDNASSPATRAVVDTAGDPRIRYVNTGRRVSMTNNYQFALSHATGEWIAMIGDDDGILPHGIERGLALVTNTGKLALSCVPVYYEWPGFDAANHQGYLKVTAGRGYMTIDSRQHILDLLSGRADFTRSPMLYTGGLIHRSIYDRMVTGPRDTLNSFNPDIYSLFAITSLTDSFVRSMEPLMITGRSSHSTGASGTSPAADLFFAEAPLPWHPGLTEPSRLAMTRSMWLYESFLQTEFLREDRPLPYDPRLQPAIATREFYRWPRNAEEVGLFETWKARFQQYHGLPATQEKVTLRQRIDDWLFDRKQALESLTGSYILTPDMGVPLNNVHDAAIAAQNIVDTRPSRLGNLTASVRRRLSARMR